MTSNVEAKPVIESVVEGSSGPSTYELGQISTSSTTTVAALHTEPTYTQQMPPSDLKNFLMRATKISTLTVTNGDVPGTVLQNLDVWNLFLADPVIAAKLENYAYIRGTIQVLGVFTSPGGGYGLYTVSALPLGDAYAPTHVGHENVLGVDHWAKMDCSASSDFAFQLPFVWPYEFAGLNSAAQPPDHMWNLTIRCLQPINTGLASGVTTGTLNVYASLTEDFVLTVPYLQGKSSQKTNRSLIANHALKTLAPQTHAMLGEGKGSAMAAQVASVASSLGMLPVIGPAASMIATGATAVSKVMDFFGFTRSTVYPGYVPVIFRSTTNLATTDSDDCSQTATLTEGAEISCDARLIGFSGSDPCAFDDLTRRWTLVKTVEWSPIDASGDVLTAIPVTPMYTSTNDEIELHLTPAGYIALPFAQWRCDMEYRIVVPVSKFHRGVLQFAWIPSGSSLTADPTNISMNVIHDVTADEDLRLQIGFAKNEPFLDTLLMGDAMPIIPYLGGNGTLTVRVVNPLVSQNSLGSTDIFIFARAANLSVQVPRNEFRWYAAGIPVTISMRNELFVQGGALGDSESEVTAHALVAYPPPVPVIDKFYGEDLKSVRALMQKPCRSRQLRNPTTFYEQLRNGPHDAPVDEPMTWAYYYSALFTGIAASERFKILTKGASAFVSASRLPGYFDNTTIPFGEIPIMAPLTFIGTQRGQEFVVPYYSPRGFITTQLPPLLGPRPFSILTTSTLPVAGDFPEVYYSLGPDIRVTCFKQTPDIYFRTAPVVLTGELFA